MFVDVGARGVPGAEGCLERGELPTVHTEGDSVSTVDLRFLVGLRVHVTAAACSSETWWRWWDAVVAAKPAHAIGVEPDGEVIEWRP